ncbi:MAG TPA: Asp-tRNA(Asn)/Glu-tRNA(Gln) amidotransferase subunit GatC, partial [Bacteroidota bacterium]|nr:Asp-tRNA(Asn)/Glu-tRNA(Gln) amidotransferase subunit GatC [Bacteroidota bacterium]
SINEVKHVAQLAHLQFSEDELKKLSHQLNDILEYIQKLNELDTTTIEPLSQVMELNNVFREDVVKPSYPREEMLQNAPRRTEKFFKVPKVIPNESSRKENMR